MIKSYTQETTLLHGAAATKRGTAATQK